MVYTGFNAVIGSWKITETSRPRIWRSERWSMPTSSRPSSLIEPLTLEFFGSSPINDIAVVDLPDPDSPTMARTSPALSSNDASMTAGYQRPSTQKSMWRWATSSTGRYGPHGRRCGSRSEVPFGSARCHDGGVHQVFRPWFGRALSVGIGAVVRDRAGGAAVRRSGDGAARRAWLALLAGSCWAVFWRPQVVVDEGGVRLVNVLRTIDLPWPSIQAVDTKWALTLITAYGRFSGWAAPAPGARATLPGRQAGGQAPPGERGVRPARCGPATCRRARAAGRRC